MARKLLAVLLIFSFSLLLVGCYTNVHVVGKGAQGNSVVEERQWYALWGLVPINTTNSNVMAGDVDDYTITTQHTFLDLLISAFTGIATVHCKSVKVQK